MSEFNSGRNDGGCYLLQVLTQNFFNFIKRFFYEILDEEREIFDWQMQPNFVREKLTCDNIIDSVSEKFSVPIFDSLKWKNCTEHRLDWLANRVTNTYFGRYEEIEEQYKLEWKNVEISCARQINEIMNCI